MASGRLYPRRTLESALRVPQAIKQHNAGNPWTSGQVAQALGVGAKSGNFFYLTSASRDYGLTEGTRDTSEISLTDLGRRAVYPSGTDEESRARLNAFLSVELFRSVLDYYGGNNLPEKQYLSNTLQTTFNLPLDQQDEFVDLFTKNCRFLGIGRTWSADSLRPSRARDSHTSDREGSDDHTVTVAAPDDESDAPVCFVIMPFTEKTDAYPTGFFDEVLERLFTPAGTNAGFAVRTARRQGSDLIQSTIVNDLLDADLVLCDLTEHNPNVLFELGLRIREEKPVALVKSRGTGPIFDVDHMLRVVEYDPNLWPSTIEVDLPAVEEHLGATWRSRDSERTFMGILRQAQ